MGCVVPSEEDPSGFYRWAILAQAGSLARSIGATETKRRSAKDPMNRHEEWRSRIDKP
jgi:hypothetical protein